jgi:hypothetical protein
MIKRIGRPGAKPTKSAFKVIKYRAKIDDAVVPGTVNVAAQESATQFGNCLLDLTEITNIMFEKIEYNFSGGLSDPSITMNSRIRLSSAAGTNEIYLRDQNDVGNSQSFEVPLMSGWLDIPLNDSANLTFFTDATDGGAFAPRPGYLFFKIAAKNIDTPQTFDVPGYDIQRV